MSNVILGEAKNKMLLLGLILSISFMSACEPIQVTDIDVKDMEFSPLSTEKVKWLEYQIQTGDSLSSIASQFNVSMETIIACNGFQNAGTIRVGDMIKIPNINGIYHIVKIDDTISTIAQIYHIPPQVIINVNGIEDDSISEGQVLLIPGAETSAEALLLGQKKLFIYPVHGRPTINRSFGWQPDPVINQLRFHKGIDFLAQTGKPVKAARAGKVMATGNNQTYGNYIIIGHNDSYHTFYAHLSAVSVNQGDHVMQGKRIGSVGNTGYTTGTQLHFGIFKDGKAVNPLVLLE